MRRKLLIVVLLSLMGIAFSCDGQPGTVCSHAGDSRTKNGQTVHCVQDPNGGLNWQ